MTLKHKTEKWWRMDTNRAWIKTGECYFEARFTAR